MSGFEPEAEEREAMPEFAELVSARAESLRKRV